MKIICNKHLRLKIIKESYGSPLPKFALGTRLKDTVEPISNFSLCRETLGSYLRSKIAIGNINKRILRLLIWFSASKVITIIKNHKTTILKGKDEDLYLEKVIEGHDKALHRALHTLNVIEKELGWRKSVIRKLEHPFNKKHVFYLIVGSPKWMFSPPLLSLYTLIIRSGTFKDLSKAKSIDDIITVYKKMGVTQVSGQSSDVERLQKIAPFLKKLLVNVSKIYEGRNQKMNFGYSVLSPASNGFNEGISKLVNKTSSDKLILKRFKEISKPVSETNSDKPISKKSGKNVTV